MSPFILFVLEHSSAAVAAWRIGIAQDLSASGTRQTSQR
jgi:hypothetical protein